MKLAYGGPLLVLACLVPAAARAESADEAEALRRYQLGLADVERGAFGEAIAEFNQAYALGHDFAVLYDIAQAYLAMDEPALALKALRKYLADGGNHVPGARRQEVEEEIARQAKRIATIVVRSQFQGAVIQVDGAEVGRTPLAENLELPAGVHVIAATAQGHRPWEMRLEVAGGDRKNLEIALEPAEPAAPDAKAAAHPELAGPAAEKASAPVSDPLARRRIVAYALGGVGVGALVVGSVFGLRAISKRNDSDAECPAGQCSQAGVDLNNQARTAARVADITIGVGLVGVGVATYLLLTMPKAQADAPAVAARGMRLRADVGPGQAGLSLRGAW
jgi:serine/threonine-protein kinase